MPLDPETRLGPYEIAVSIGAGGMGEVYRARETKLNRDVAVKVPPDLFARDPDRLSRFEREAQTLAAVSHPTIAQVFGVLESPPALIFYLNGDTMMAVPIALGASVPVGKPQKLFDAPIRTRGQSDFFQYDVAPDGQRFLAVAFRNAREPLHVIVNWRSLVEDK